ncbi:MAG: FCD domain-containing protein [Bacteroidales bacterium]|nr:FCD domain-containing protein [Bacteroidales bacterium]
MNKEQETTLKIQALIDTGRLPAGEKLPGERKLCEMLGVSRGEVRKALQKLEFCGVIHTEAQRGSYVSDHYFSSLVSTRILLESEASRLSAELRTEEEMSRIIAARDAFEAHPCVELDLAFHYTIMQASHNTVLTALWKTAIAEVEAYYQKYSVCRPDDPEVLHGHALLAQMIFEHKPQEAAEALARHLNSIRELSQKIDK